MAFYGTAAGVKRLSPLITDLVTQALMTDETIADLGNQEANPIIDGVLYGRGAPFTTAPAIIATIANLICAGAIFEAYLSHRDDLSGWGNGKRKQAIDLLDRILNGEINASGITEPDLMAISDPTLDRPETEVFSGDETTWQQRTEARE